jgi:hypothetical protein
LCIGKNHCGARVLCGKPYSSKTFNGECSNEGCLNLRADGSRFCVDCSYNYAKKKYEKKD